VVSEVDPSGRLVARKRSRDDADALRLTHEAEVLDAARHPGVVELVSCESAGGGATELVTTFVGTHTLETAGALSTERAAGLVAALAETLADLHDLGVVHGRIDPSHVLVGPGGRPVLCGFAGGGRIGTTPPPGSATSAGFADPAATGAPLSPSVDVFGLGGLLRSLVVDEGAEVEPIPDRRFAFGRVRVPWSGYQRRALLTLADRATDEAPLRRPPARRLAADILDSVPTARLGDDTAAARRDTTPPHDGNKGTRWMRVGVVAAVAALALAFVGNVGATGSRPGAAEPAVPPLSAESVAPSTTAAATTLVENGRVIVSGARRYEAGVAGDRVAVGDWDCDGVTTPAVLRPATGALFVFDQWATADNDVSVAPRATVAGAVDVLARDRGDGCSTLVVVREDGTEEEIR
jgi:hypothetical protein